MACTIVAEIANTIAAAMIAWSGCNAAGTGLQNALDSIGQFGGGRLELQGPGTVVVDEPLRPGNNTTLVGTAGVVTVVGKPLVNGYRGQGDPLNRTLIAIHNRQNVTVSNLTLDGIQADYPTTTSLVFTGLSTDIALQHLFVKCSRMCLAIWNSNRVSVSHSIIHNHSIPYDEYKSGASVWVFQSDNVLIHRNVMDSADFWLAGPPKWDVRPDPKGMDTVVDMIAVYGSDNSRIFANTLTNGPTAGIYLACSLVDTHPCPEEHKTTNATLINNTVAHFHQFGIDVSQVSGVGIYNNSVLSTGLASLSLAGETSGAKVWFNVFRKAGNGWPAWDTGTIVAFRCITDAVIRRNVISHSLPVSMRFKGAEKVAGHKYCSSTGNTFAENQIDGSVKGAGNNVWGNE